MGSSAATSTGPNSAPVPGACPPAINAATVNSIKQSEGFVAGPEPDPVNLLTVGFGHKCRKVKCAEVPVSFPLSQDIPAQLLQNDATTFTNCVNQFVSPSVQLNDNQFGSLASFAFNLGCGTLKSLALLKWLNPGEDPNTVAQQEIGKFNKAAEEVLPGLQKRRAAEVALFQTPSTTVAHSCN
ncbi:hypothetical protein D9756_004452 [Leucocoprinus leucothites]|uniref:Lysozyme n=1 Tax=Leucocoprinus leucothites TaxID=201217 RepID=A0A8H5LKQ0_9AGAR|nr:hypothetical protein D9756_004452 [Leucoagaricus leucothites]